MSVKGGLSSQKPRLPDRINVLSRRLLRPRVSLQEFPREGLPAQEQLTSPIKRNTPRHNVCFWFFCLHRTATESPVRLKSTQRRGSGNLLSLTCARRRTRRVSKTSLERVNKTGAGVQDGSQFFPKRCESVGASHWNFPAGLPCKGFLHLASSPRRVETRARLA